MIYGESYSERSDEELMQLVGKKDSAAFSVLYDRYSTRIVNYFFKMLWQDEEKAQDFMQELFTKLIEKPHLFDPTRSFKTWVFSIAHNMCKNEYRKQGIRGEVHAESTSELRNIKGETGGEITMKVDRGNFNRELHKALDELDEIKKTTFILRYLDELSIKEISEIMECSEGTVKSRIFYTLKLLHEKLKAFEGLIVAFILASLAFLKII